LNFYDQMVIVEKGWVENEFVLFITCRIATWNKVAKWVNILQDTSYITHTDITTRALPSLTATTTLPPWLEWNSTLKKL